MNAAMKGKRFDLDFTGIAPFLSYYSARLIGSLSERS